MSTKLNWSELTRADFSTEDLDEILRLHIADIQAIQASTTNVSNPTPNSVKTRPLKNRRRRRPATANQQMLERLTKDASAIDLSASDWAAVLDCSSQNVKQTPAWNVIMKARALEQAQRSSRLREPQPKRKRRAKPGLPNQG